MLIRITPDATAIDDPVDGEIGEAVVRAERDPGMDLPGLAAPRGPKGGAIERTWPPAIAAWSWAAELGDRRWR
jgi:hypothetical protein